MIDWHDAIDKFLFLLFFPVSFGGVAGLFLGISLLSVAEICFYILTISFSVCFRKWIGKSKYKKAQYQYTIRNVL